MLEQFLALVEKLCCNFSITCREIVLVFLVYDTPDTSLSDKRYNITRVSLYEDRGEQLGASLF